MPWICRACVREMRQSGTDHVYVFPSPAETPPFCSIGNCDVQASASDVLAGIAARDARPSRSEEKVSAALAPEFLSNGDAAKRAAVKSKTIRAWIRQGLLPRHGTPRELRVRVADLDQLIAQGPKRAAPTHMPRPASTPEAAARRAFENRKTPAKKRAAPRLRKPTRTRPSTKSTTPKFKLLKGGADGEHLRTR